MLNTMLDEVTQRIVKRSEHSRRAYLERIQLAQDQGRQRGHLSCGNLAHGVAACESPSKTALLGDDAPNIGIISAYNDVLSAHQPYERYPELIRRTAGELGAVAQFAGGVPAMCDGVTQGQDGMELSLFSRDVIAMSTGIALSHNMFDAVVCLGICDKIVPGLLIGALSFGHLPTLLIPAGPMPSGLPNGEKAKVREAHAAGLVGRDELIAAESASYHSPGTCTFYGTANSNQMLMEFMGLQLPGSSFVNPDNPLRDELTNSAVAHVLKLLSSEPGYRPIGRIVSEQAIVNGLVGLLATGGSTNHTIHLIAIAAAAGIKIDWQDFADLSTVVPLLAKVYPNGMADINHFHNAGGLGFLIRELLDGGLLHRDVLTITGDDLGSYTEEPFAGTQGVEWRPISSVSGDLNVVRPLSDPFHPEGGLNVVGGNVGRAVVKVSAVAPEHRNVTAPARVFYSQQQFVDAFEADELNADMVAVLIFQGPKANGMPELHRLTPFLGVLQNKGYKVALMTDGRMSGASGRVLAAIHVTPEALDGGMIGRIRDGDLITLDAGAGSLQVAADLSAREDAPPPSQTPATGCGRELFQVLRQHVGSADTGASILGLG